eukprot:6232327-Amphidinium_carterae.1
MEHSLLPTRLSLSLSLSLLVSYDNNVMRTLYVAMSCQYCRAKNGAKKKENTAASAQGLKQ